MRLVTRKSLDPGSLVGKQRAEHNYFGISLPGDYQQVMYVVEDCYGDDCGWAAYAYVNSWNSVYAGLSYLS